MEQQVRFSHKLIPSDAEFIKFAIKYNIILIATLVSLGRMGKLEMIDLDNFELSKVTFHETMGMLARMMAFFYWHGSTQCITSAMLEDKSKTNTTGFKRIDIEVPMLSGFLTLAFYLMNLFGFFFGLLCLTISPPSLFLVQEFVKRRRRNLKESQD
ncbi:hypothetical protein CARUB_v10018935mg [Capsella rubella]|uniref:Transmembrane protein n=1 Tax=Capsella rubella TaxID=81985 RepID=R0FS36_9BRAS|nr:hypothetical protein CARUB_v10018935mg [Capsella rubella]